MHDIFHNDQMEKKYKGEEEVKYTGNDLALHHENIIPVEKANFRAFNDDYEIPIDDGLVCWLDPIDGTSMYIKGELDAVTTLVGLSRNEKPFLGVVTRHFVETINKKYQKSPRAYFAMAEDPKLYAIDFDQKSNLNLKAKEHPILQRNPNEPLKLLTSHPHYKKNFEQCFSKMNNAKIILQGGGGIKFLKVIEGSCDAFLAPPLPRYTYKFWDTCACSAILQAIGGRVTDYNENNLTYPLSVPKYEHPIGVISSRSSDIHSQLMRVIKG